LSQQLPMLTFLFALKERLENSRVCCGNDWKRVVTDSLTWRIGETFIFLDPPYNQQAQRAGKLYTCDDLTISTAVREWCLENVTLKQNGKIIYQGRRYRYPKLKIALCGYEREHGPHMPSDWHCITWKANGGYANRNTKNNNATQERIWFSPACQNPLALPQQLPLLGEIS